MILCICPNPSVDCIVRVPELIPDNVYRAQDKECFPGGKGIHVAMAARELGEDTAVLGIWAGPDGEWLRQQCLDRGIPCHGPVVAGTSRNCLTILTDDGGETEVRGLGPEITQSDIDAFVDTAESLAADESIITGSGSWPPGAPDDAWAQVLAVVPAARTYLDCAAPYLKPALEQRPFAIRLNRDEATDATAAADPEIAAARLLEHCERAIVSAGADGAWFDGDGHSVHGTCAPSTVVATVGSGDCMLAGLAVAAVRDLNMNDTVRLAMACAAANCMTPHLGILRREDVDALLADVQISP